LSQQKGTNGSRLHPPPNFPRESKKLAFSLKRSHAPLVEDAFMKTRSVRPAAPKVLPLESRIGCPVFHGGLRMTTPDPADTIPDYQSLILPVLRAAANGEQQHIGTVVQKRGGELGLGEAAHAALLPSGRRTIFANRVHRAETYMAVRYGGSAARGRACPRPQR